MELLQPLHTTQVLFGAIAHPWVGFDLYGHAGQEQVNEKFWNQPSGAALWERDRVATAIRPA